MRIKHFLLLLLSIYFSGALYGQQLEDDHHFQLDASKIINDISRNSIQNIQLGQASIKAKFVPNNIMSPDVKKQTPGVETYNLINEEGKIFGNAVLSNQSVWINYWDNNKLKVLVPDLETDNPHDHYIDYGRKMEPFSCNAHELPPNDQNTSIEEDPRFNTSTTRGNQRNGDIKRNYRVAIVCTGEFYELNGNNNTDVNAVIVASVSGIEAIYLRELSISFTITGKKIYTNSGTDPFDPNHPDNRTVKAGQAINMNFNSNSYDLGHALHRSSLDDGWDSGGLARRPAVCIDQVSNGSPAKAKGWSGSYNTTGYSWYSLFGHEVGHMFDAEHTFNGTGESCTDNISETNAYEMASGISIMSYNGICADNQNIPANGEADNYFHIASLLQMTNYIENAGNCSSNTASNNSIPDITGNPCGTNIMIPKNTPFYLQGEGIDDDGDDIYFSWEQFDEDGPGTSSQGKIGSAASNSTKGPLFRNFPPSKGQFERYFPDLATLADGVTSDNFQALPNRARTLHFKLVGRDFASNGGAYGFDDVEVEIINSGPLAVTAPTANTTHNAGEMMTVSWNPNGSEDLCDKVVIKLSIDKGLTYFELATDIDYSSGTTNVQVPGYLTSTENAIVMVSCDDIACAQFFDISNGTFNIDSDCDAPASYICPAEDLVFDQGDAGLNLDLSHTTGENISSLSRSINIPDIPIVLFETNGTSCEEFFNVEAGVAYISVSESGQYLFNTDIESGGGFGFVTIFDNDNYNNNSPCSSFISSSATSTGMVGGASASSIMLAELDACKTYRINFYNYSANVMNITGISGPGDVILVDPAGTPNYSYAYIAVNNSNNVLTAYSDNADFTSLPGGVYSIYGIHYINDGNTDLENYVGQIFFNFYEEGDCFRNSVNYFTLEVVATCVMQNPTLGSSSNCNPDDNTFTQEIEINFSDLPSMGDIIANGQSFTISANPQTITYIAQSDGGVESVEIRYSEEPDCVYTIVFDQKENCCNFEIPFSGTVPLCENTEIEIDAGAGGEGGGSYVWSKDDVGLSEISRNLSITEAGSYKVVVTNATGCPVKGAIEVTSSPTPELTGVSDFDLCENTDMTVMVTTNAMDISWSKDGNIISGEVSSSLVVSDEGDYIVKAISSDNCENELAFEVTEILAPVVDLGDDKTTCIGNEELLTAPSGTNYVYSWTILGNEISNEQTITITENTVVNLEVSNEEECSSEDEITITFEPGPTLSIDQTMVELCEGEQIDITATTNATNISWKKDDVILPGETGTILTVSESGTYTAHVEGNSGCEVEKQATVFVHPYPVNDLASEFIGCEGTMINLSPTSSAFKYQWISPSGDVISTSKEVQVSEPGEYELIMTNEFDCSTNNTTTVSFTTRPTIDLMSTLDICEGESTTLNATSNGMTYQWEKDGQEINGETSLSLDVSSAGQYTLFAYNGSDCFETAFTTVTSRSAPFVDLGSDYTICPGENIMLDAENNGSTYSWSTSETTQSITIDHPGDVTMETNLVVSVAVTNEFNCTTTGETDVLLYPNIIAQIDGDMGVCIGDTISLTASGGQVFDWTGENLSSLTGETVEVFPTESTTYSVEVTDTQCSGQTESAQFAVEVYTPSIATGGEDKSVILGSDVKLFGSGGVSYQWSPDSTIIEGQGTATPTVNPTVETTYAVVITDVNGCEQTDSVHVIIVEDPLALLKHVTIITPNDDGLNDFLEFRGLETFPHNTLTIYNRWGEIVYSAIDYQKGEGRFDGTRNGEELPLDTYFYVLKFDQYTIKERLSIVRP